MPPSPPLRLDAAPARAPRREHRRRRLPALIVVVIVVRAILVRISTGAIVRQPERLHMPAGQAHGDDGQRGVDGLREELRGQRELAQVLVAVGHGGLGVRGVGLLV